MPKRVRVDVIRFIRLIPGMIVVFQILVFPVIGKGQESQLNTGYDSLCQVQFQQVITILKSPEVENLFNYGNLSDSLLRANLVFQTSSYDTIHSSGEDKYHRADYFSKQMDMMRAWLKSRDQAERLCLRKTSKVADKNIYKGLKPFSLENAFAVFAAKSPDETLFYVLFIPGSYFKSPFPKLLSWNLTITPQGCYFTDFGGKLGTEAWFDLQSNLPHQKRLF